MIIKTGAVVVHPGATAWGVGKITEVSALKATIQFSDGIIRKIASSHYASLQPGDPTAFVAAVATPIADKTRTAIKKPKKPKAATVYSDGTPR
ncbi:MAG: DUF3553 domain-containing protein [Geobacter sp.]|nr:DUF3553 domain-containing protein [Geobacter sp.]